MCLLPLYLITFICFNPRLRAASETASRHISNISGNVHEQFSPIALVNSFTAEQREAARFMQDNEQQLRHVRQQSHVGHSMGAISEALPARHVGISYTDSFSRTWR